IGTERGARRINQRLLADEIIGSECDAAVFVLRCVKLRPLYARRQAFRRRRQACRYCRNQVFLPDLAVELPLAEPEQDRDANNGKDGRHDNAAPPFGNVHSSPRYSTRPSAALWWNCSAISRLFIGRSGSTVKITINGSHRTACTQTGG